LDLALKYLGWLASGKSLKFIRVNQSPTACGIAASSTQADLVAASVIFATEVETRGFRVRVERVADLDHSRAIEYHLRQRPETDRRSGRDCSRQGASRLC